MRFFDWMIVVYVFAACLGGTYAEARRLMARREDRDRIRQLETTVAVLERWERIRRTEERERHPGDAGV